LFASDTQLLELCDAALSVIHVCMIAYWVLLFFSAIETNEDCAEEGEVFEYQEEGDQGQANQGKPSTCCISESY
jgi:hypothetical protein